MNETNFLIDKKSAITLQQQLINQITKAIASKELEHGDSLPSINQISNELNISRDTVFKAYRELKNMGIVGSTPAKGYFVRQQLKKVLLVLDYFSPFKEILHNTIQSNLKAGYSIDVVFHHYNKRMYKNIIQQNTGLYDYYVVMNIDTESFKIYPLIKKLDPSKLIFIDIPVKDWRDFKEEKYACVFQGFDEAVYNELMKIKDRILKYRSFNLVNTRNLNHPAITEEYFIRFCYDNEIDCKIYNNLSGIKVLKDEAFFILRQSDLSSLLGECKKANLKTGKDTGIIAFNDTPLYEFIDNGITVITTDFELMGKKTADIILNRNIEKITIPTGVILRGSL